MTREQLLRELLVERFGKPVREYRGSDLEAAARLRELEQAVADVEPTEDDGPAEDPAAEAVRRYEAAVRDDVTATRRHESALAAVEQETTDGSQPAA